MFEAAPSPYLVEPDGDFRIALQPTEAPGEFPSKGAAKQMLRAAVAELAELQQALYAEDRWSVLLIFQAMDAAGKDGTIRRLLSGVNPAGCQVMAFKRPSAREIDHDFLWRTSMRVPERGRIGVFNRSYYEEVLVVRVHPQIVAGQRLPHVVMPEAKEDFWAERMRSIAAHERHLAANGTAIVKFFLNVSRSEQRRRFLSRLVEPEKRWKFSEGDLEEAQHWDAYMEAYEDALRHTSVPWAPWYAIPADHKPTMRALVADIVVRSIRSLAATYPQVPDDDQARMDVLRTELEREVQDASLRAGS